MNIDLNVPDFSTLSRRSGEITINIPKNNKENIIAAVDSSGLKVYGEGGMESQKAWLVKTPYLVKNASNDYT